MTVKRRSRAAKLALAFYMKNNNSFTAPNNRASLRRSSSAPLSRKTDKARSRASSEGNDNNKKKRKMKNSEYESKGVAKEEEEECGASAMLQRSSARERLQSYRKEVAGRVRIPDAWAEDEEQRLKEWADPKVVDRCLAPDDLLSARTALIRDSICTFISPSSSS